MTATALGDGRGRVPPILPLRPVGRVQGRVTGEDGKPLAGALVRTLPAWGDRVPGGATPGTSLEDLHRSLVAGEVLHAFLRQTRTDGQGRFDLAMAVPPGQEWAVECSQDGYLPQRIKGSETGRNCDFRMVPAAGSAEGDPALAFRFEGWQGQVALELRLNGTFMADGDRWRSGEPYRLPLPRAGIYRLQVEWKDEGGWHLQEPRRLQVRGSLDCPVRKE